MNRLVGIDQKVAFNTLNVSCYITKLYTNIFDKGNFILLLKKCDIIDEDMLVEKWILT